MKTPPLLIVGILGALAVTAFAVKDPLKRFIVGRVPNPNPAQKKNTPTVVVVSLPPDLRGFIRA